MQRYLTARLSVTFVVFLEKASYRSGSGISNMTKAARQFNGRFDNFGTR